MHRLRKFFDLKSNWVFLTIAIVCIIAWIADRMRYDTVGAVLYLIGAGMLYSTFMSRMDQRSQRNDEEYNRALEENPVIQSARMLERGELPSLSDSPIAEDDEITHFHCEAIRYMDDDFAAIRAAQASEYEPVPVSTIVLRRKIRVHRDDYSGNAGKFLGAFAMTDKRLVFLHERHGFSCTYDDLADVSEADMGKILIQAKDSRCLLHLLVARDEKTGMTAIVNGAHSLLWETASFVKQS